MDKKEKRRKRRTRRKLIKYFLFLCYTYNKEVIVLYEKILKTFIQSFWSSFLILFLLRKNDLLLKTIFITALSTSFSAILNLLLKEYDKKQQRKITILKDLKKMQQDFKYNKFYNDTLYKTINFLERKGKNGRF